MSAIAEGRPKRDPVGGVCFVLFVIIIVAIAMLLNLPGVLPCHDSPGDAGTVADLNHADLKHGLDAELAREWVGKNGHRCKWICPDGRDRFVCPMDNGQWAIVVVERTGEEVTAFVTSRESYARGKTFGCDFDLLGCLLWILGISR